MGLSAPSASGALAGGGRRRGRFPPPEPLPAVPSGGRLALPGRSAVRTAAGRARLPSVLPPSARPAGGLLVRPVRQQQRSPVAVELVRVAGLHERRRLERLRGGRRVLHERAQRHVGRQPAPAAAAATAAASEVAAQLRRPGAEEVRRRVVGRLEKVGLAEERRTGQPVWNAARRPLPDDFEDVRRLVDERGRLLR